MRRYRLSSSYPGRITLFLHDVETPEQQRHYQSVWRKLPIGELDIHNVPGKHLTTFEEPNVQILVEQLRVCLRQALDSAEGVKSGPGGTRNISTARI